MNTPLVSCIIPTHDRASLLPTAIESVLAQKCNDQEVIVVDDDSSDNTAAVVATYPVRYIKIKGGTPSRTRNAGITAACGKYISFLDDDDVWTPDWLSNAVDILEASPQLGMVYGQVQLCDDNLENPGYVYPVAPLAEGHPIMAILQTTLCMNAIVVRRCVFTDIGMFDESVFGAEDLDLQLRIARAFPCAAIEKTLSLIRVHARPEIDVERLWRRLRDQEMVLHRHLSIRDAHRPKWRQRQGIWFRYRGWYVHHFLSLAEQASNAKEQNKKWQSVLFALRTSPLHTVIDRRFWSHVLSST